MTTPPNPTNWQRIFVVLGSCVLAVAALYWAQAVLIPVALAVMFTFLLGPAVSAVQRWGLRRTPSVIVVVTLAFLLLGGIGWIVFAQVSRLAGDLPVYEKNIETKIANLREAGKGSILERIQNTFKKVDTALKKQEEPSSTAFPIKPVPVVVQDEGPLTLDKIPRILGPLLEPLAGAGLVIILVIFMLINREDLRNRLISLIGRGKLTITTKAIDDAAQRISRYLLMQLIINGSFGLAVGVGLFFIGVPYAFLWGFVAAVLRYIPYLGPWLAALLPITLSLVAFDGWTRLLLVIGLFVVLELISNNVMEPLLYGHSIGVSEVALLIALAFWTWLWGPIGLVLATPLTVCLIVLGKYVPQLEFLSVLLGDQQVLDDDVTYYQRLLARDQDEAMDLVEDHVKTHPVAQVFDDLLIPALTYARRDHERDELTDEDEQFVFQATRELMEELGRKERRDQASGSGSGTEERAKTLALPGERTKILGFPAREDGDEIALSMLQQMLDSSKYDVELASSEMLSAEMVALVEQKEPAAVCIAALPPGGLAHTRYLCKRLRTRFPDLKILVGRWGLRMNEEKNQQVLLDAGATQVATTLLESRKQIIQLSQLENGKLADLKVGDEVTVKFEEQGGKNIVTSIERK